MRNFARKNFFIFFWLIASLDIIATAFNIHSLHQVAKPLLLPILTAALLLHTSASKHRWIILVGLIFSFLGDVFLLAEDTNPLFFIFGLVSFLITHIFYCCYFLGVMRIGTSLLKQKPYFLLLTAIYTAGLLYFLIPRLGNLTIPVILYACVLSLMFVCSLYAFNFVKPSAAKLFVTGAAFFVISDSLLVINKFYIAFAAAGFLIMLTYCLAQYFIVRGFIKNQPAERLSTSI